MSIRMAVSCTSCDWTVDEIHVKATQLRCLRDSKKNQTEHRAQQIIRRWKLKAPKCCDMLQRGKSAAETEREAAVVPEAWVTPQGCTRYRGQGARNKKYLALGNQKLLRQRYRNWQGKLTCTAQNTVSEVRSEAAHQITWRICFLPALQSVYQALFRWGSISACRQSFWRFLPHHVGHSLSRENHATRCKHCSIISKKHKWQRRPRPCGEAWVPRTEVLDMHTSQNPLGGMGTVIFLFFLAFCLWIAGIPDVCSRKLVAPAVHSWMKPSNGKL